AFLANNNVEIVASLPCYLKENVDKQRGNGIFEKSITGLKKLNDLGYGKIGSGLSLNLVYNPLGAFLPPDAFKLEKDYKFRLMEDFGIEFNSLLTITNIPIHRFKNWLIKRDKYESYMNLLIDNFNPETVENVMCTEMISVGYDGYIYDCDFNQMLGETLIGEEKTIYDINSFDSITEKIYLDNHCYGCTAGKGSSCSGSLV
ncbi:MAG: DUF3641 domain-containing protein, partial [Leptospiraceae bacterium]|nr:DUF3641 domain-containing protein [Leptospiraceae bacterium]